MKNARVDVEGVHVIRVKGDSLERARGHLELLKAEAQNGALKTLAKKNEWLIRRGPGPTQFKPLQDAAVWLYKNVLLPKMVSGDPETKKLIHAVAEQSGVDYETVLGAVYQPDALMLLSRLSVMQYFFKDLPVAGMPGCSSGVVLRDWTKDRKLLACRNLDYPLADSWEKQTTVIFQEPTAGKEIPYVSVSTAGVHTGGLTSMNSAGLTLAVHAHFGRHVSLKGKPIIEIGDEIIRKAKTLSEAVDIAKRLRTHAAWTFVVSSAKENDAIAIEMTPDLTVVRHAEDGYLGHTNYFHSKELQKDEAAISGAVTEDCLSRLCRLKELLGQKRGSLVATDLASALGDHYDSMTQTSRVVGNTVSVVSTVASVVFEPQDQRLWVSTRKQSPTALGDFLEIDVEKFWNPGYVPAKMKPPSSLSPRFLQAIDHFQKAYTSWHTHNHLDHIAETSRAELFKAATLYPEDGNLWLQLGIVDFYLKRTHDALENFQQALTRKLAHHSMAVCQLYVARCFDLNGNRLAAKAIYQTVDSISEPKLKDAYRHGLRKSFRFSKFSTMMVDLQFADTICY